MKKLSFMLILSTLFITNTWATKIECNTTFKLRDVKMVFDLSEGEGGMAGTVTLLNFPEELKFENITLNVDEVSRDIGSSVRYAMCARNSTGIVLAAENDYPLSMRVCLDPEDDSIILDSSSRGIVVKLSTAWDYYNFPGDSDISSWDGDCKIIK